MNTDTKANKYWNVFACYVYDKLNTADKSQTATPQMIIEKPIIIQEKPLEKPTDEPIENSTIEDNNVFTPLNEFPEVEPVPAVMDDIERSTVLPDPVPPIEESAESPAVEDSSVFVPSDNLSELESNIPVFDDIQKSTILPDRVPETPVGSSEQSIEETANLSESILADIITSSAPIIEEKAEIPKATTVNVEPPEQQLSDDENDKKDNTWICPKCGTELGKNDNYCFNCGYRKPDSEIVDTSDIAQVEPIDFQEKMPFTVVEELHPATDADNRLYHTIADFLGDEMQDEDESEGDSSHGA